MYTYDSSNNMSSIEKKATENNEDDDGKITIKAKCLKTYGTSLFFEDFSLLELQNTKKSAWKKRRREEIKLCYFIRMQFFSCDCWIVLKFI